eukprot:1843716-Rhodomonas_salina.1
MWSRSTWRTWDVVSADASSFQPRPQNPPRGVESRSLDGLSTTHTQQQQQQTESHCAKQHLFINLTALEFDG